MDYPKSVPGVGLVNGKFVDENATTGQVGSLIPSAWGNAVTDELLAILAFAGIVPDETKFNQVLAALQKMFAPLTSPAFAGAPTAPTPVSTDNSTRISTTAFVKAVAAAVAGDSAQLFAVAAASQAQHAVNLGQFVAANSPQGYFQIPVIVAGVKRAIIVQWDTVNVTAVNGNWSAFSYPIRFPNRCLAVVGNRQAPGTNAVMLFGQAVGDGPGQVVVQNFAASAEIGSYIAIGW